MGRGGARGGLNRTKVGLKDNSTQIALRTSYSLNRTKVGLKENTH